MATTQKKSTGGARTSTASSRKATTSKSTAAKSTSSSTRKSSTPARRPIRREVGAVVCVLLAIFSAFGYFSISAIFIDFFCGLIKRLIGYGFWLMPPALLGASIILGLHRGRPVRLRVWCTLLIPVMLGAILHLILQPTLTSSGLGIIVELWTTGSLLTSGGVCSGLLTMGLSAVFSGLGAGIIFVVATIVMVMVVLCITPVTIVDYIRNHPHEEYEEYEEYEEEEVAPPSRRTKEKKTALAPVPPPPSRQKGAIDIPMDDDATDTASVQAPKKGLFNRKSAVPSPDALLTGGETETPKEELFTAPTPTPTPVAPPLAPIIDPIDLTSSVPEPIAPPVAEVPLPPMPEIEREPAVPPKKSLKKGAETALAAAEVAHDIEKRMMEEEATTYQYPPVSLLKEASAIDGADVAGELRANQARLSDTIRSFGIDATIANVTRGPSVTRYELELEQGVRLNKLTNLSDDIALALGASGVRIAPIPDQISMVGIEVPNKLVTTVSMHEVIDSKAFRDSASKVSFTVGKDIGDNNIVGNIAKLPHMLIAGTTGSGKSVCTNSLIISLLYKATPEEVRLIMVDPKMVELGIYNGIPHLLIPVVTDPKKAAGALQWAVTEMMKRYRSFSEAGVRDLASYNAMAAKTEGVEKMPQIVIVIDELADLMLVAAKEVEESICRVAQMGRASGMHLIIATQRPSADVITGLMKANIPSRIAFAVASSLESRIILDNTGAEKLVGRGDMLYFPVGTGKPQRVQGCFISDPEVAAVVEFIKKNSGSADYDDSIMTQIEKNAAEKEKGAKGSGTSSASAVDGNDDSYDELLPTAIEVVVDTGMASVSMLQRRLKLGYSRAARLVDQMEEKGVVGAFEGSKPRQVLITKAQWQEMQYKQGMNEPPMAAEQTPPPYSEPVPEELPYEGDAIDQSPPFDLDN